jgi:integrase
LQNLTEFFKHPKSAENQHRILDGKLTLFKRPESSLWQFRFKLPSGQWHVLSTGLDDLALAKPQAITMYEAIIIRAEAGINPKTKTFKQVAELELANMTKAIQQKTGKRTYRDYAFAINKYLIPFFGKTDINAITTEMIYDFEQWRIAEMGKVPMASTKRNHASAYNRIINFARERGIIPFNKGVPLLDAKGEKSQPRPAFTEQELDELRLSIPSWIDSALLDRSRQIRHLLSVYIEVLVNTGIRHSTEAMPIRWRHLQWHWIGEKKYLRIWVSGKTGPRYLIAKHKVVEVLEGLIAWQKLPFETLDQLIEAKLDKLVFRLPCGDQPTNFENIFRGLMKFSGLWKDSGDKKRTLYSLRHTYATFALADGIDIHTLARQMGTSVGMIEKHYSKLTPMLSAEKLA